MTPMPQIQESPLDDQFQEWLVSLTAPTQETTRRLVTDTKLSSEDVTMGWFAVEVVGDDHPKLVKFDTYAAMVDHARRRVQRDGVRLFLWWGAPVRLTKGEFKFVVHPTGERTPLFSVPEPSAMEFDDDGQFTDDSDEPIGEVTELNVGGQTIPLADSSDSAVDEFDDSAAYEEYDEVEDEQEFVDEEPDNLVDAEEDEEEYEEGDEEED